MDIDTDESLDKRPFKQKPIAMRQDVKTEPDQPTCTQLFKSGDEVITNFQFWKIGSLKLDLHGPICCVLSVAYNKSANVLCQYHLKTYKSMEN